MTRTTAASLAVVVTLSATTLLAGCGDDQKSNAAENPPVSTPAKQAPAPVFGLGQPAPDFTLATLSGEPVTLSKLRGKAVLVDFWATWCGPCRAAMPHFQELSQQYAEDLAVVGVSLDQDPLTAVPPYVQRAGLTFTVTVDTGAANVSEAWGQVRSIPTTYLVDPKGVVVQRWVGVNPKAVYEQEIRKVLGKS